MIAVSLTFTLKGRKEEEKFFELLDHALEHVHLVAGLVDVVASKVWGNPFCYHLFSVWKSEVDIADWLKSPVYHEVLCKRGTALIDSLVSSRWQLMDGPRMIETQA
jgi:heme-degrading monooxygenase HmoA